jgi:deoxyribonuclease (pyrimidine dimer)
MVFSSLRRTLDSKVGFNYKKIHDRCPLGGGHVYFFYDKLEYLKNRYLEIIKEMHSRGFNPDSSRPVNFNGLPPTLYNNYSPSKAEKDLLKKRILSRIQRKQEWYRYRGRPLQETYFKMFIRS